MRKPGDTCMFTGGAENTPRVIVSNFHQPCSLNHGKPNLLIVQFVGEERRQVSLSPETMKAILAWYECGDLIGGEPKT